MPFGLSYLQLQYICQVVLCAYGARQSYVAITNLRKYEATTKKLAKWSSEVDQQLWKTRKTQATGAITILASTVVSVSLAFFSSHLHTYARVSLSPLMLVGVLAARHYVGKFWAPVKDKSGKPVGTKVPLPNLEDYNVAVQSTEQLLVVLEYLEYSTVASMVVSTMAGGQAWTSK